MTKFLDYVKRNMVLLLICIQPFLDIVAFWTQSDAGTVSGYIRLLTMLFLCFFVLLKKKGLKSRLPAFVLIVFVFGMHVAVHMLCGYIGFMSDARMVLLFAYLPVLALCFSCIIDNDEAYGQVISALKFNFAAEISVIVISYVTGTYMPTYTEGLGIAGWVISDNRCCHSDIIASLSVFAGYIAVTSKKKSVNLLLPPVLFLLLITNGTKVCYLVLMAICFCFPVFLLIRALISHVRLDASQRLSALVLAVLFVATIVVYPVTPRAEMEELKKQNFDDKELRFAQEMDELGYNVYNVTLDEIFSDDLLHEKFVDYYKLFVFSNVDPMGRIYSFDRIITAYNGTVDSGVLGDARDMKNVYVGFIFSDSGVLNKLFGIEYDMIGQDKSFDVENDWYAVLYYFGYVGLAAAAAGAVFVLLKIALYVKKNTLKTVLTDDINFTLLFGFALQLGMAYFSGAIFRRPNASIYVALFIAMIMYRTNDRSCRQ